jgi:small-conductance mechanosensitive channel
MMAVSSLLVSFAFAIGPSLLVLVNSVVFLFVQHPFDVGDRVFVDGENVVCREGGVRAPAALACVLSIECGGADSWCTR